MLKTIYLLLNWNLKHLHACLKKKVFYSFDSFHDSKHQVLNVLISVDYILNIIKIKIPLLQAQVTIPKFWYPVDTCWPSCFQRLLNYFGFQSYDHECTLWRLFQKHFVISKFDICICILWLFFFKFNQFWGFLLYLKHYIQPVLCNLGLLKELSLCSCLWEINNQF
jgi:hypothetical protein